MSRTSHFTLRSFIAFTVVACGAALVLWPLAGLTPNQSRAAGLVVATIGLLATSAIPEYLTALMMFLAAMLLKIAPAEVIFAGFTSAAVWLVLGGLVLGVAITSTGLGKRVADRLATHLDGSYSRIITGMATLGIGFAFIMPSSMGRVALLVPVSVALAKHFGFGEGSNGRTGIILATVLSTFIPAFAILPANVPNMILAGMAESQLQTSLLYGEYLWLHFPVLGIVKVALIIVTILWMYPDQPQVVAQETTASPAPMQRKEKALSGVIAVLLLLWMTDFLHHISPAWIALAGAVFLLIPRVGIVSANEFNTRINYGSIFFVAGLIGLGSIIKSSGLGQMLGQGLLTVLPLGPDAALGNYFSVALSSTLTGMITTQPGVPAVMVPLSPEMAGATGLPIKTILMMQVVGFSTMFLPYQAPPVIVALQMSGESTQRVLKPLLFIAVISYCVLIPLNYLWWVALGMFNLN